MVNSGIIAAALLQLVALAILSTTLLVQTLRTKRRSWRYRRFSFGVAVMSIGSFVCAGIVTAVFFLSQFDLAVLLRAGLLLTVVGLASFLLFIGALYDEHGTELRRE